MSKIGVVTEVTPDSETSAKTEARTNQIHIDRKSSGKEPHRSINLLLHADMHEYSNGRSPSEACTM